MTAESDFQDLLRRVRAREDDACAEFLCTFRPALERMARVRLVSSGLRNRIGASDVIQSVMALFFDRAIEGKYLLDRPADFQKLAAKMIQRKVNDHRKKRHAQKRGDDKPDVALANDPIDLEAAPDETVAIVEFEQIIWNWLTHEEQELLRLVIWEELSWPEVGGRLGTTKEAARKRYERICANARQRWQKEWNIDCIYHEVLHREQSGQAVDLDGYSARFPGLAEDLNRLRVVHKWIGSLGKNAQQSAEICQDLVAHAKHAK